MLPDQQELCAQSLLLRVFIIKVQVPRLKIANITERSKVEGKEYFLSLKTPHFYPVSFLSTRLKATRFQLLRILPECLSCGRVNNLPQHISDLTGHTLPGGQVKMEMPI